MEEDKKSPVYIPEEILFNILIRLPANVLYDVMRYVCWRWYNIIASPDFVKAHLDRSTNSLAILYCNKSDSFESCTISKDLSLTRLDFTSNYIVSDSCDGLVVIENSKLGNDCGRRPIYIVNPITRQCIPYFCYPSFSNAVAGLKFGRSISGVYKLLDCYYSLSERCLIKSAILVLSLGKGKDDDWRTITLGDESLTETHGFDHALTVGGCFYMVMHCNNNEWNRCEKDDHPSGFFILALDLETEMVSHIPAPPSCKFGHAILSITGGSFSFLAYTEDKREFCVWRLGSAGSRDWDMVCKYKIGCLDQFDHGSSLRFLGWVIDGEVLAVCCLTSGYAFTYNVKTGNTTPIDKRLVQQYDTLRVIYHADGLVRL